jgi:hypothetical protein
MTKIITLTQGREAIVDDEDYEYLNQWKWFYARCGYATGHVNCHSKTVYMHRVIMETPTGMETDHVNGDKLDNRKNNLRMCTSQQNKANKTKENNNTSGYKGVTWDKSRKTWNAKIMINYKCINLGRFVNIVDAARAYDEAATKLFGNFAKTNF